MKKVLVVDDNREIRQLVKTTLGMDEYTIYEACNGTAAVEMARQCRPDLIIMDVMMPDGVDGIEATHLIKANPLSADCRIIILTGSEGERENEGVDAGADGFMIKPFSPLDLLGKIEEVLNPACQ